MNSVLEFSGIVLSMSTGVDVPERSDLYNRSRSPSSSLLSLSNTGRFSSGPLSCSLGLPLILKLTPFGLSFSNLFFSLAVSCNVIK